MKVSTSGVKRPGPSCQVVYLPPTRVAFQHFRIIRITLRNVSDPAGFLGTFSEYKNPWLVHKPHKPQVVPEGTLTGDPSNAASHHSMHERDAGGGEGLRPANSSHSLGILSECSARQKSDGQSCATEISFGGEKKDRGSVLLHTMSSILRAECYQREGQSLEKTEN